MRILLSIVLISLLSGCSSFTSQPASATTPPVVLGTQTILMAQQRILDLYDAGVIPAAQMKQVATAVFTTQAILDTYNMFATGTQGGVLSAPAQNQAQLDVRWASVKAK
jgi:uncharacterized protein YceK